MENLQLAKIANQVRKDIVTGVYNAKSGHPVDLFQQRYVNIFVF